MFQLYLCPVRARGSTVRLRWAHHAWRHCLRYPLAQGKVRLKVRSPLPKRNSYTTGSIVVDNRRDFENSLGPSSKKLFRQPDSEIRLRVEVIQLLVRSIWALTCAEKVVAARSRTDGSSTFQVVCLIREVSSRVAAMVQKIDVSPSYRNVCGGIRRKLRLKHNEKVITPSKTDFSFQISSLSLFHCPVSSWGQRNRVG